MCKYSWLHKQICSQDSFSAWNEWDTRRISMNLKVRNGFHIILEEPD